MEQEQVTGGLRVVSELTLSGLFWVAFAEERERETEEAGEGEKELWVEANSEGEAH